MKKIISINIDSGQAYVVTLVGVFLLLIGGTLFSSSTGQNSLGDINIIIAILVFLATITVHELLHGIGFYLMGAKPKYGVGRVGIIPFAYATSSNRLLLWQMLVVAYLPFIVLSACFIVLANAFPDYQQYALIGFLSNFAGAAGDIWISTKLLRYAFLNNVFVIDTKNGLDVYSDNPGAKARGAKVKKRSTATNSFLKQWSIFSFIVIATSIVLPIIISLFGFKGSYTLGFDQFYIFRINIAANGSEDITYNFLASILLALLATIFLKILKQSAKKL